MTSLESLEYFSILKIILIHRSYTTLWIYSDQFKSDVICEYFMEKHEFQPKSFFDLNNFQNSESLNFNYEQQHFQDTLHVFFIRQSLEEHVLDHVPTEDNIVVISDNNNVNRMESLKKAKHFGRNILFITSLNLCLVKLSKNLYELESVSCNSNKTILHNFVRNAFLRHCSYSQYNMNGSVLKTFFRQKGANSFITLFGNKLMFFGPDGFLTEQLGKLLNGTMESNTDYGIDYPNYIDFFTKGGYPYNDFIHFYKELVTTNVISYFNRSESEYADLYMSSQQLKSENRRSEKSTEFLYPHITDCLRIIVPKINDMYTFPSKLIRNQYCQTICLAFILMTLFKTIFGRMVVGKWRNDIFTTLSIFLAQGKATKSNRSNQSWESIWMGLLVTLSLITTTLLSALCYKTIVSVQFHKQINSLQDLIESNLTIFVPQMLVDDIEAWGSTLSPKFIEKIVIGDKMYMLKSEQFAFVWPEGMAEMVLKLPPVNVSVREMRIMKEPLYCGLVSHSVPFKSPLKRMVNIVARRTIEHGLRKTQLEWSQRFFNAMSLKQKSFEIQEISSKGLTLNMAQLSGVFIMYGFGICMSFSVALIELLCKVKYAAMKNYLNCLM